MQPADLILFLFVMAAGSYIQTLTGFAMGLIVMGAVTIFHIAPVAFSAVVVSIMALLNTALALRREHHVVNWKMVILICAGALPAVAAGLYLLNHLSTSSTLVLRLLLGSFILTSGFLLMLRPHPRIKPSPGTVSLLAGIIGGLFGGLFSTAGPPIVYHLYRQPLSISAIRTTLYAVFAISTITRISLVGLNGEITWDILKLSLMSAPLVAGLTLLGKKFRPPLSDLVMRRGAFGLLMLLGAFLVVTSL
jgi:uncharacterized membrane protein YfcA